MVRSYFIRIGLIGISVLFIAGCTQSPYYVVPISKSFLPNKGQTQKTGEAQFKPGEEMFNTPVGYPVSVQLKEATSFLIIDRKFSFDAGDILVPARISGKSSISILKNSITFCGSQHKNIEQGLLGATTLGLSSLAYRTSILSQVCFIDANNDHNAEQVILVGVKDEKDAAPVNIPPVPYKILLDEPLKGESIASIRYLGKVGIFNNRIGFELKVIESGNGLRFNNDRKVVALKDIPQTVNIAGVLFTIKSYDPLDESIKVDIAEGFRKTGYEINSYTTTIPIYIAR